jgi:hypothetical protein
VGIGQGRTRVVWSMRPTSPTSAGPAASPLRVRRGVIRVGGSLALVVALPPVSDLMETRLLGSLIRVGNDGPRALLLVGR